MLFKKIFKAEYFGERVSKTLQRIFKHSIPLEPELFLLSIIPTEDSRDLSYVLIHITTAARMISAQMWKNSETPVTEMLVKKYMSL